MAILPPSPVPAVPQHYLETTSLQPPVSLVRLAPLSAAMRLAYQRATLLPVSSSAALSLVPCSVLQSMISRPALQQPDFSPEKQPYLRLSFL